MDTQMYDDNRVAASLDRPSVVDALNRVDSAIESVNKAWDSLDSRLTPVLTSRAPESSGTEKAASGGDHSDLFNSIVSMAMRLNQLEYRIMSTSSRLQL